MKHVFQAGRSLAVLADGTGKGGVRTELLALTLMVGANRRTGPCPNNRPHIRKHGIKVTLLMNCDEKL